MVGPSGQSSYAVVASIQDPSGMTRMQYTNRSMEGATAYRAIVPQTGKPVRTPPSTPVRFHLCNPPQLQWALSIGADWVCASSAADGDVDWQCDVRECVIRCSCGTRRIKWIAIEYATAIATRCHATDRDSSEDRATTGTDYRMR
jgi:hypothetical protein